jgi:hypothetical protein
MLLVVAPDEAVARWCAQPIALGHPGFTLQPLVAGPEAIPVLVDEREARKDPELAVLSAMAHGHERVGQTIVRTVLAVVEGLEAERVRLYVDLAMSSLGEAARSALEALMRSDKYEYQSEFARKYVAEGLQQGIQQGREEGRYEGERAALFEVLAARGIELDAAAGQQILSCSDQEQLKSWLRKAATAESAQELFASGPTSKPATRRASKHGQGTKAPRSRSKR